MHILVTGTDGYIGSHLYRAVRKRWPSANIFACDPKSGIDYKNLGGYSFDYVFHLGAISTIINSFEIADKMMEINALNLIPFLRNNKVGKIIFSSTGAIYGETTHPVKEEEAKWTKCISPYSQSKYIAEGIIRRMAGRHIIARFGNVYGGDYGNVMLSIPHFRKDNPIVLYGGQQIRDFVHVNTVCEALIRGAESRLSDTFNIANGVPARIDAIAKMYAEERGVPLVYKPIRPGDVTCSVLNVDKARAAGLLPSEPEVNDYHS